MTDIGTSAFPLALVSLDDASDALASVAAGAGDVAAAEATVAVNVVGSE